MHEVPQRRPSSYTQPISQVRRARSGTTLENHNSRHTEYHQVVHNGTLEPCQVHPPHYTPQLHNSPGTPTNQTQHRVAKSLKVAKGLPCAAINYTFYLGGRFSTCLLIAWAVYSGASHFLAPDNSGQEPQSCSTLAALNEIQNWPHADLEAQLKLLAKNGQLQRIKVGEDEVVTLVPGAGQECSAADQAVVAWFASTPEGKRMLLRLARSDQSVNKPR